jgi:hypothetical protein
MLPVNSIQILLPLLALFSPASAVLNDPIKCPPGLGLPGGFYMCRGTNFDPANDYCTWVHPSLTASCYQFPGDRHHRPWSIGPDPGGYCTLFFGKNCDGWGVKVPSEGWDEEHG